MNENDENLGSEGKAEEVDVTEDIGMSIFGVILITLGIIGFLDPSESVWPFVLFGVGVLILVVAARRVNQEKPKAKLWRWMHGADKKDDQVRHMHYWHYPHSVIEGLTSSEVAVVRYCSGCPERQVAFAKEWRKAEGDYALDEHFVGHRVEEEGSL